MIFYFSGTGNSLYVAKTIAKNIGDDYTSIASIINASSEEYVYCLKENEAIGFVFPTYAWATPKVVEAFIDKLILKNYKDNFIYSIATCGGNSGNLLKAFGKLIKEKNMNLNSGFVVRMPNNYIISSDIDNEKITEEKLSKAKEYIEYISENIKSRRANVFESVNAFYDKPLTKLVSPLFNKFALNNTKKFYVNSNCTSCGLCEKICVSNTIKVSVKPVWGDKCTQCLACINWCPVKAIQYGKGTEKRKRYNNKNISANELVIR
ncbi:4Fe-4S ferredoxin [Clostridium zeae]|uniref:4Fe-4S ferredoxin n=1 Tax=Clostridium zeae TaxID=2759022 RepID=A0ABQ1E8B8_9CLOT|nr:EFR1 family ferrodoxin [Clostridium zeae]GFZ31032.1 4Fe-4S ferredoxin [Clostridium zeae]